jgi:hypothetical protein
MQTAWRTKAVSAVTALLTLTLALSAACGGGGDRPAAPGGFTVATAPTTVSIMAGNFSIVGIVVTRTGSFSAAVGLRIDGAPTGVTTDLSPVSVPAGSTTAGVTITVSATTTPGTYPLTVSGSAAGMATRTATLTLVVTERPGRFDLSLTPGTLTIRQGLNNTVDIAVTRVAPFAGAVALSVEGAPTGVSTSLSPAVIPVGSTSATLTVAVATTAAPGAYAITVRATATGVPEQTMAFSLTVTADPGSFTLALSQATLSVEQRLSGVVGVTLTRVAPFVGAVNVVVDNAPAGVTATLAPQTFGTGVSAGTLTLSTGAAVPAGTYVLTVRGVATGVPESSATLTLTVTPSPGGITLVAAPITVMRGQVGSATLTVTRIAPFAGAITLAIEGLPPDVTVSLTPAVIPAGQTTAQITYTVLATASASTHGVVVRGSGTGIATQQTTHTLTITLPPSPTVTFQFCDPMRQPLWVGYQNGTDQWTHVAGAGGTYALAITSDKGAMAFVTPTAGVSGAGFDVMLVYGTREELAEAGTQSCALMPPTKTLTGTLGGRTVDDVVNVIVGSGLSQILPSQGPGFQLFDAVAGVRDLVAVRTTFTTPLPPSTMIVRRGTNYAAGSAIPVLDFGSGEAVATTMQTVTVGNSGTDQVLMKQAYVTSGGTNGVFPTMAITSNPWIYMVVPPVAAVAGDVYSLRFESRVTPADPTTRVVSHTFVNATAQSLSFGPMLTIPTTFTLQAAPFYQARVQSTLQPDYNKSYFGRYRQPTRTGAFYATAAFIGSTTVDITTPDLTHVPGWRSEWGPLPGISTTLSASAFGWTGTAKTLFPGWFGDVMTEPGVLLKSAMRSMVMTP